MGCPAETALEKMREGWAPFVCPPTVVDGIITEDGDQLIEGEVYFGKRARPGTRASFIKATPGEANTLKKFYLKERELVPA